ncbi:MAG: xylulokinase [Spirochaetota bacterium]
MATRQTLSIDIGTSSLKTAVIDSAGDVVSLLRRELPEPGSSIQLAAMWEEQLEQMLAAQLPESSIEAVCVTGNGPTIVPLGEDLKPLFPVISWSDTPSLQREGVPSLFLPKLLFAAEQQPELVEKTRLFVGCPEYISGVLCGEFLTFIPDQRFLPFIWDEAQISTCGLSVSQFPPPVLLGDRIGRVTGEAAKRFGLPPGVPMYAGMSDFHAALLGSGTVLPGMACDRAGTSEGINVITKRGSSVPSLRTLPYVVPETFTIAALLPASGEVFTWYRKHYGLTHLPYERLMEQIVRDEGDRSLFYPQQSRDPSRQYASGGGLFLPGENGSPSTIGRAVVEGIGFSVREALENLGEAGYEVPLLRHSGGQARSASWNHLKAQLLHLPLEIPALPDAELLGCTVASLFGKGDYSSPREAAEELVKIEQTYVPVEQIASYYDERYSVWKQYKPV